MIVGDLYNIVLQIVAPVGLLAWFAFAPLRSRLGYALHALLTLFVLAALTLMPIWLMPPWWTPWLYLGVFALTALGRLLRGRAVARPPLPSSAGGWFAVALTAVATSVIALMLSTAIAGRRAPVEPVALASPLGPGQYLVVNGGASASINAHFLTLNPQTERQRAYRGQSYAVDLVGVGPLGLRAPGWRPRDPQRYRIFGAPVLAPCAGAVLAAGDGRPDMPVPEMDQARIEGNFVFLDCGGVGVLLGHLREGSVRVAAGDTVATGDPIGNVGNSGQTGEPHLHVHAQTIPPGPPWFAGEPRFITLDGRFLVRNDLLTVEATTAAE